MKPSPCPDLEALLRVEDEMFFPESELFEGTAIVMRIVDQSVTGVGDWKEQGGVGEHSGLKLWACDAFISYKKTSFPRARE